MSTGSLGPFYSSGVTEPTPARAPVTIRTLASMRERGEVFACLTCYDATTARILERAGVHVLLVGDTAAQVILGLERTIDMPLEVALALTAGVKRGAPNTCVMGDMPFMSYQASPDDAARNAGRFLTQGLADVVKIEADRTLAPLVDRLTRMGVPICGHLGCKPQASAVTSGYRAAGRTAEEARQIVRDARELQDAGAVLLLLEAVPDEVTREVLGATSIPVIGIGAGPECHGQVLVLQDLLGLTDDPPRFALPVATLAPSIHDAAAEWVRRVGGRRIGGQRYTMKPGEAAKLASPGSQTRPAPPGAGATDR